MKIKALLALSLLTLSCNATLQAQEEEPWPPKAFWGCWKLVPNEDIHETDSQIFLCLHRHHMMVIRLESQKDRVDSGIALPLVTTRTRDVLLEASALLRNGTQQLYKFEITPAEPDDFLLMSRTLFIPRKQQKHIYKRLEKSPERYKRVEHEEGVRLAKELLSNQEAEIDNEAREVLSHWISSRASSSR